MLLFLMKPIFKRLTESLAVWLESAK